MFFFVCVTIIFYFFNYILSCITFCCRQWLPKTKMVPFGVDKTIDKNKMLEARTSSTRKAVQSAFTRAMKHLSLVQDFNDGD